MRMQYRKVPVTVFSPWITEGTEGYPLFGEVDTADHGGMRSIFSSG